MVILQLNINSMENPRWPQAVFMAWDMPIWLNYAFEIYILSIFNL